VVELMTKAFAWFEGASGWANFFGIATPVVGIFFAIRKKIFRKKTAGFSMSELAENILRSQKPINSKLVAKIAFVDDDISDFPIAELKRAGYQISTYKQVSLADVTDLATYDVIFLDIKGIVKDDPEEGGLKLLTSLRKINPNQKICAVSNKQYDVLATKFFEQADDVAKKPMTAHKCSDLIDQFLTEKFNIDQIEKTINSESDSLDKARRADFISSVNRLVGSQEDLRSTLKLDSSSHPKLYEAAVDLVRLYRHVA